MDDSVERLKSEFYQHASTIVRMLPAVPHDLATKVVATLVMGACGAVSQDEIDAVLNEIAEWADMHKMMSQPGISAAGDLTGWLENTGWARL